MSQQNRSSLTLCNVEDVKRFLGKQDASTEDDDLIADLIVEQGELIEQYCDRKFNLRIYKEFHKGKGSNMMRTRQYPIVNIGGKQPVPNQQVYPQTAYGEMIDYSQSQAGIVTQVTSGSPITLGVWDDVAWDFTPGYQASGTQKPPYEVIVSRECPGKIQLAGDIFIDSQLWSFYNLENIMLIYQAGYAQMPFAIRFGCAKLAALEYARSKALISSIECEKDPSKMVQEIWDNMSQYRMVM